MLYSFDEVTGALQFSHKVELQTKDLLSILFIFSLILYMVYQKSGFHLIRTYTDMQLGRNLPKTYTVLLPRGF